MYQSVAHTEVLPNNNIVIESRSILVRRMYLRSQHSWLY